MKLGFCAWCLTAALHAGGAFTVSRDARGRWNFHDAQGKAFFSKGCDAVIARDESAKPKAPGYDALKIFGGDKPAWAQAAAKRLKSYGFNTLGAWSDAALYGQGLVITHTLSLAGYDKDRLVGVWGTEFQAKVEAKALAETAPLRENPRLLGYYLDNELPWYGDTGWPGPQNTPLINKYMALAPGPDRSQAETALKEFYGSDQPPGDGAYPQKLQEAFASRVADKYFELCAAALKKADPLHLNLGVRFAGSTYDGVIQACGKYCDVVSLNMYSKSGDFNIKLADRMHVLAGGKPLLISEFSYRAMRNRSGDPNSAGADVTVDTQAERAGHLKSFLQGGLDLPYLVGYHWFEYADESPQGRSFDGENSNYGLVDIQDREYEELRAAFVEINASAVRRHAKAAHEVPTDAGASREPRLRDIGATTAPGGQRRVYIDFQDCKTDKVNLWNEASAKGGFECRDQALTFTFDSGSQWGLGLGFAPARSDNSDGSADLLHYRRLEIRVKVGKGKRFSIYLSESGVGEPSLKDHGGVGGADGESWESPVMTGSGKTETYSVDLAALQLRSSWGNQDGNRIIDTQAVKSIDFYVAGNQGQGEIVLESLIFR